ncbi:MAG: ThuA domain-containing protein [Rhodothermales bacterium]
MTTLLRTTLALLVAGACLLATPEALAQTQPRLLVFSKTAGFRHDSIEPGIEAVRALGAANGFAVDATEDAAAFTEQNLQAYRAVVFLNTTGDVLDAMQQNAFERFIQGGGGYVGIHAATDTEYEWAWYGRLAGAYFANHPMPDNVQQGTFHIVDRDFPGMANLPEPWVRTDEFYAYKEMNPDVTVLITIDEKTYRGGTNGDYHPMAWYHAFDGGRAFYTNMGHTKSTFSEPLYLEHLLGGIQYAIGQTDVDFARAHTPRMPEENRFTKHILGEKLDEPLELTVLPDERVLFVERPGNVKLYSPVTNDIKVIATIPVSTQYIGGAVAEDGLLGIAASPDFATTGWIYLYYSVAGDQAVNRLSRFNLRGDDLDLGSENVVLEVPVQRLQCCHTAGSIAFDAAGNLYLSTGDNTNPHGTGYAPIDERPDRFPWDAQKSSANTNDLRGKILRIHPEADGSYTIPAGNLFPPGTAKTRPEIYTMGHRNPYRISVDKHTGYLYWGDVGPDAPRDSVDLGPAGHDEVGQARRAGNFGWPYFVGDNKAYVDRDFATKTIGARYDPAHPVNRSPNNTGLNDLPPAMPAFIWYPAAESPDFPILGAGGRSAMAGPVFHRDDFKGAEGAFPDYYDGKLFIYEFMRGWIMAVTMNDAGDLLSIEPFMPSYKFSSPLDLEFGPSGDLYMLEYGSGWFQGNDDARLVRISYNGGNRPPVARLRVDKPAGATPLTTTLSASDTEDFDGDALTYSWAISTLDGKPVTTLSGESVTLTLDKTGIYTADLTVTDAAGATSRSAQTLVVGNEPPEVSVEITGGNGTFFFPGKPIHYAAHVRDLEDGSLADGTIPEDQVAVSITYQQGYEQVATEQGHRSADASAVAAAGQRLVEGSDCRSCHGIDTKSIGPAYVDVAAKYRNDSTAPEKLAAKVMEGGSGVWGDIMMPPHPQFSRAEVDQMVAYVLSIGQSEALASLPTAGSYLPDIPATATEGAVIVRAAYSDRGAPGAASASNEATLVLRSATVPVHEATIEKDVMRFSGPQMPMPIVIGSMPGAYIGFEALDLTAIREVTFMGIAPSQGLPSAGGSLELRLGAPDGPVIGETNAIQPTEGFTNMQPMTASLTPTDGRHDLYVVFKNPEASPTQPICILLTMQFKTESAGGSMGAAPRNAGGGGAGLSTRSTLTTLLAHPGAVDVLERHMPGFTTDPRIEPAMSMSIRDIAPYAPDVFTAEMLSKLDEDLGAL